MPRAQVDRKAGATAMHDEDGPSVREAREEKRLEDRSIWIMLLCGFPLIYFAVAYPSLTTLIIFQAYILTFTVAGMLGIKKRAVLKQKWFLNAMAYSLPIHLVAIAGILEQRGMARPDEV